VPAVVVVNSLTLTHDERTHLGQSLVAIFYYRLIRKSQIFARFSAMGMGMGVGLYVGWLIREYMR